MTDGLAQFLVDTEQRIEAALERWIRNSASPYADQSSIAGTATLFEAMRYAVIGGGKRLRAALMYASHDAIGPGSASLEDLDRLAVAIECLHAYSLVHDDLPAMDNDDLRRGKPSCHRAYGEATAILAGDALQSLSFELLGDCDSIAAERRLAIVSCLAQAIGPRGMAGGQAIDLAASGQSVDESQLEIMHNLKTGALIRAAVSAGAIAANADRRTCLLLDDYARAIGLAFQIRDDILDVEASTGILGKTAGADLAANKSTYVGVIGIEASRARLSGRIKQAREALRPLGVRARLLRELADFIENRAH